MLMLIHRLGKSYIVWDKSAQIEYKQPAKSHVIAHFILSDERTEEIKLLVQQKGTVYPSFEIQIKDKDGQVVALVKKVLYVKKKVQRD